MKTVRLPKNNDRSFMSAIKWHLFGIKVSAYLYGICNGILARKHKNTGDVQFIIWKKGDQKYIDGIGHAENKWTSFHSSLRSGFKQIIKNK